MRRKIYLFITILFFSFCAGCSSSQTSDGSDLSQADKDAAVEVVTKHLEGRKNDFGVISLSINSVQAVENAQHLQNILEDEDAAKMGLTKENIALVDAYINVQNDGTKVPNQSGDNVYIGFTLIRQNKDSPWLINDYGQGLGGVSFMDFLNPYPEKSAELYVWKNENQSLLVGQIPGGIHLACLEWGTNVISLTKDEKQLISGHNWYSEFEKIAREIALDVEMNLYDMDGMYAKIPQEPIRKVPYANLSEHSTADGVIDWIAIGGDWQPFPCVVSYEKYTLENQPQNEAWLEHFTGMLSEDISDTPIVITEAWFLDLDGDGKNEAFVNARNTVPSENHAAAKPPSKTQTGVYSFCVLFSDSLGAVNLDSNSWFIEYDFSKEGISASYTEPVGENYYYNDVTAIQYGENGEYMISPIFNKGPHEPPPRSYPIVSDIDGDGKAELLCFRQQVYGPVSVYAAEDGKLVFRYGVYTSA